MATFHLIVRRLLLVFMKHEKTGIESSNLVASVPNRPYIITCDNFKIIYNIHVCRSLNFKPDARARLIRGILWKQFYSAYNKTRVSVQYVYFI